MNVRIEHELKAAGGIEISIAAAAANRPVYEAEYQRFAHGQETMQQAAQNIGAHYSQHESSHGMSYHDYYQSEYRRLGGK
jgi:predicted TPR repeat methyltransferase